MIENYIAFSLVSFFILLAVTINEIVCFCRVSSKNGIKTLSDVWSSKFVVKTNKVAVLYFSWVIKLPIIAVIVYLNYDYYISILSLSGLMLSIFMVFTCLYFAVTLLIDALNPFYVLRKSFLYRNMKDEDIYRRKKIISMAMVLLHSGIVLFFFTPYIYSLPS